MCRVLARQFSKRALIVTVAVAAGAWGAFPQARPATRAAMADSVREALRIRIEQAGIPLRLIVGSERVHAAETTARFYEARAYEPGWTSGPDRLRAAEELVSVISRAREEGLEPSHYHTDILRERLLALPGTRNPEGTIAPGVLVDLELLLTDAFVLYGAHLLSGHVNPETIDPEWFAARRGGDLAETLEQALGSGEISAALAALSPPQPGYKLLKRALSRYRGMRAWPSIEDGAPLRLGGRGPRVASLRELLIVTGDLAATSPESSENDLFDEDLENAMQRFQERHGVDVDGVAGKDTMLELNRPVGERIEQIVINLERWRWLPQTLGHRHVLVNIAGFSVHAIEDGEPVLEMKAIVGRTYRRTPVFSDQISYLVLNPSWTIPQSIAVQDKLPLIREDPAYLSKQRIRVLSGWGADAHEVEPASIDWAALGDKGFPYRLRQEPGRLNALGAIKFMFPNKFNVYLHDTPARELFAKSARDFSSGCIRIEKPDGLALFLLAPDPTWNFEKLRSSLATEREQTVRLPEPVSVHIQYWSAWVDGRGAVQFRRDLYKRDAKVLQALLEPPPAS